LECRKESEGCMKEREKESWKKRERRRPENRANLYIEWKGKDR